jgi:hypothetical protein
VLLFLQLLTGCTNRTSYDPFLISQDEFRNTARTIALAPVIGPPGIEVAESLLVQIDMLIEGMLLGSGYQCIPKHEYVGTWDHILTQMGGLYDEATGDLDELKVEVAREQLRRDLLEVYQADFVLHAEIWIVDAAYSGGVAKWDGTSQSIVGFGTRLLNLIDVILGEYEGFLQPGMINALSLGVVVENMEGVEIFQNAGGIEVLKDSDRENRGDESVLFEAVLADRKRNLQAVRTALSPLVEGRSEGSPRD